MKDLSCVCCGKRILPQDAHTDAQHTICDSCYRKSYTRCDACETMIHIEDACRDKEKTYCCACYEERFRHIHPHDYKPTPIFYGAVPRFFGVELEIDGGGHSDEHAKMLLDAVNTDDEYIYIKRDRSLVDGLEIVTHPMTLKYHLRQFNWNRLLHTAILLGYHADDAPTCGLHIHVNRQSLGAIPTEQQAAIQRIQVFLKKHWYKILRFSRRSDEYCKRMTICGNVAALNPDHPQTVEFRMFQGTLQSATLYACLQSVDRICSIAQTSTDMEIQALTWHGFLRTVYDEELLMFLGEHELLYSVGRKFSPQ